MSVYAGGTEPACLNSRAHCCSAPSIWRRLLMQEFFCAVVLALMKLGIAIAANRPIMATTIMISTRVKPPLRVVFLFILNFSFYYGVNTATSGLVLLRIVFTYCPLLTVLENVTGAWLKSITK